MKIMHTSSNEVDSPRPTRRYYSPQLKTEVIQQCRQSGASVAGVALAPVKALSVFAPVQLAQKRGLPGGYSIGSSKLAAFN